MGLKHIHLMDEWMDALKLLFNLENSCGTLKTIENNLTLLIVISNIFKCLVGFKEMWMFQNTAINMIVKYGRLNKGF